MYKTKNKKNKRHKKTRKYHGGAPINAPINAVANTNNSATFKPSEGVFNILGDKISSFSSSAFKYIEEKGLRAAGLEKIDDQENDANPVEDGVNKASSLVSNSINNVNNVLKSPVVQETVTAAAKDLAETGTKLLDNFNQVASTPAFEQAVKNAADNAAVYTGIVVDSMDEPVNKAMDELNEAGTKAAAGVSAGLIKVGTDAMAAVPGAGAIVEVGKMLNDGSKAIGDVVESGTKVIEIVSKVVSETSGNIDKGLDNLQAKKQRIEGLTGQKLNIPNISNPLTSASAAMTNHMTNASNALTNQKLNISNPLTSASAAMTNHMTNASNALTNASNSVTNQMTNLTPTNIQKGGLKKIVNDKQQIGGRINDSLAEFSDPIGYQSILKGGNNKTKKLFVKSKGKSKRVRFSM